MPMSSGYLFLTIAMIAFPVISTRPLSFSYPGSGMISGLNYSTACMTIPSPRIM